MRWVGLQFSDVDTNYDLGGTTDNQQWLSGVWQSNTGTDAKLGFLTMTADLALNACGDDFAGAGDP